jgi:hypothetical protein
MRTRPTRVDKEAHEFVSRAQVLHKIFAEAIGLFEMAQASFEQPVTDRILRSRYHDAYVVIRRALFRSLILEIAGLNFDDNPTNINPSIRALIRQLGEEEKKPNVKLINWLRDGYLRVAKGSGRALRARFDAHLQETLSLWASVKGTSAWVGLKTLRDKVIAHFDIQFSGGSRPTSIDIANCGLTVEDFAEIQAKTERLVCLLHEIATGVTLDYSGAHKKALDAAQAFWADVVKNL